MSILGQISKDVLSFLLGACLVLAFAPFHWGVLAVACPTLLYVIWCHSSPKRALWRGFLFGLGQFGFGVSWVYISIYRFGHAPTLVAAGITFLFIAILALFPAINGYVLRRWIRHPSTLGHLTFFPVTWVVFELIRSNLFGGFPWLVLGYSQVGTWISGYAPIVGVFGVSLLLCFLGGLFIALFELRGLRQLLCLVLAVAISLGGYCLKSISWTHSVEQPVHVAIVQGNIPQSLKWDPHLATQTVAKYWRMTQPYIGSPLIFWPENAIPLFPQQIQAQLDIFDRILKQHNATLLTGIPIYQAASKQYFNGAKVLGVGSGTYLKRHLVPFGEYVPLASLFGHFFQFMNIPMANFSSGPEQQKTVQMHHDPVGIMICYESAFALESRHYNQHVRLLAVLSNDAWFGNSIGPIQHEQITQMRALETGRYIVTATNTGITSIIAPDGHIIKQLPSFTASVLTGEVEMRRGTTPWMQYGLWPLVLIMLLLLAIGWNYRKPVR